MPYYYYEQPFFTMERQGREGASIFEHKSQRKRFFCAPNFYLNLIFIGNRLNEGVNVENQSTLQIKMFRVGQKWQKTKQGEERQKEEQKNYVGNYTGILKIQL